MRGAPLHLYRLSEPRRIVFDEVHFGAFVNAYCGDHRYFFDVHPPHAKLLIAGVAALGGYRGEQPFEQLDQPFRTEPGPGFAWAIPTGDFLFDTVRIHRLMLTSNYTLSTAHPYASDWWSWPLMQRPIYYWSHADAALYFLGNPVLWWGTALGLPLVLANGVLLRVSDLRLPGGRGAWPQLFWIPLLGYAIALLPLVHVPRALFLYHYLTPLLFGLCAVILWLDHVGWTRAGDLRSQRTSVFAAMAGLVLGFLAISPFSFSFITAPAYRELVFGLLPSWR